MRYVISYDLNSPGQDYQSLYDALEAMGAKRVLESQWGVRRKNTTAKTLRNHFWKYMDSNDRILVIAIDGTGFASYGLINKIKSI